MKIQNFKQKAQKLCVAAVLVTGSAVAAADGIGDIGTTMSTEIAKTVPVVSSVGMALLSVYVVVRAFKLVSGFLGGK